MSKISLWKSETLKCNHSSPDHSSFAHTIPFYNKEVQIISITISYCKETNSYLNIYRTSIGLSTKPIMHAWRVLYVCKWSKTFIENYWYVPKHPSIKCPTKICFSITGIIEVCHWCKHSLLYISKQPIIQYFT